MTSVETRESPLPARTGASRMFGYGDVSKSTWTITLAAALASLAMNFWIPFLPLYMLRLGATTDANALFWVGVATTGQGVARLISGPVWGILSDRMGRKIMFIRALYFATGTTLIAAFATEPWHVAVAFACQGLFSGFIPAAVALTSVSVSEDRLSESLGMVTGGQYLGNTVGPAVGAILAVFLGLRGAIMAAAIMPALAATMVLFVVPRDHVELKTATTSPLPGERRPGVRSLMTGQFCLALFLYFFLFAMSQLIRLATPISLKEITGHEGSAGVVGAAFTIAGVASVIGVLFVARRFVKEGAFRRALVVGCVFTGIAHVLLALAGSVPLFIAWFSVISLAQAAMVPVTNTLVAANVPRALRGTAFGLASSAQALAFMVGPMSAAIFAAVSLDLGFVLLGVLFVGLALLIAAALREPRAEAQAAAT